MPACRRDDLFRARSIATHHVVERLGVSVWDWLFLGVGGVGFIVLGWLIIGPARRDAMPGELADRP